MGRLPLIAVAVAAWLVAAPAPAARGPACERPPWGAAAEARGASQLVTVAVPRRGATTAALRLWRRVADGCWAAAGGPWAARVGRNGVSSSRREGDGTTPAGVYGLGQVVYGNGPDPGVRYSYRRLACGDWWDEDPSSPTYNRFVHVRCGARPPFATTSPGLWEEKHAYRHLAVVEFNTSPAVPGRGSGIFIHADHGQATRGCISLPLPRLVRLLRWLRPDAAPAVAIGVRG